MRSLFVRQFEDESGYHKSSVPQITYGWNNNQCYLSSSLYKSDIIHKHITSYK